MILIGSHVQESKSYDNDEMAFKIRVICGHLKELETEYKNLLRMADEKRPFLEDMAIFNKDREFERNNCGNIEKILKYYGDNVTFWTHCKNSAKNKLLSDPLYKEATLLECYNKLKLNYFKIR
jgi:hypothetical protein